MPVKCFFSGIESDQHFNQCVSAGAKHVLTSFLYLQKKGDMDIVKKRKEKFPHLQFMIDSGAHSFQVDAAKYSSWSLTDYEDYLKSYTKWLLANRRHIFCGVELDIDYNVGANVVAGWQQRYFLPLQEQGVEIIYVWHTERGLQGWEDMCSKFPYVGLPGEMSADPDFNKYITVARRYATKIHGFAATKQADFRDWPWYSIDSITWKTSEMYGTLIDWDDNKQVLSFEQDKSKRALYRQKFISLGLNADGIIQDTDYKEVTKYALISMRKMEDFYERKYADRLFYYDLRLPHPARVLRWKKDATILKWWKKFRPEQLFKAHLSAPPSSIREYLFGISCVQHSLRDLLEPKPLALQFLQAYWPKQANPLTQDMQTFQKEVAAYTAPTNSAAIPRTAPGHLIPTNAPKRRDEVNFDLEDLEHRIQDTPLILEEL